MAFYEKYDKKQKNRGARGEFADRGERGFAKGAKRDFDKKESRFGGKKQSFERGFSGAGKFEREERRFGKQSTDGKRYGENRFDVKSFDRRDFDKGERRGFSKSAPKRSFEKVERRYSENRFDVKSFGRKEFEKENRTFQKKGRFADHSRREKPFTREERPFAREEKPFIREAKPAEVFAPVAFEEEKPSSLIVGRNPIREALKAGRDIEKILVQEGELTGSAGEIVANARKIGVKIQVVDKRKLNSYAKNHQGLVAFASAHDYAQLDDILALAKERNEAPFIVILDQITDPNNLGAIIRSCSCMGAHGVVLPLHRAVGLTPSAVKTSAGAVEFIKVARVTNLSRTIADLKKMGIWVYAADADGEDYRRSDFKDALALVIGSEGDGISKLVKEQCDKVIKIPMTGEISSLNASVAAGILMHAVYNARNAL